VVAAARVAAAVALPAEPVAALAVELAWAVAAVVLAAEPVPVVAAAVLAAEPVLPAVLAAEPVSRLLPLNNAIGQRNRRAAFSKAALLCLHRQAPKPKMVWKRQFADTRRRVSDDVDKRGARLNNLDRYRRASKGIDGYRRPSTMISPPILSTAIDDHPISPAS
jgi:hypothetical protein